MRIVYNGRETSLIPEAYDIDAAEQEAIVPNPLVVESDPLSLLEKALQIYMQVYQLTGCENRAAAAYYEMLKVPMP